MSSVQAEVQIDEAVRTCDNVLIRDRMPYRIIKLTDVGVDTFRAITKGSLATAAARRLASRLVDAEMAHPTPEEPADSTITTTVVVPVRDRPELLDRCLAALGPAAPVIVVDDGSVDARAVADVCDFHGVRLLRLPLSVGPSAARNAGLELVDSAVVAFVDSDVAVTPDWHNNLTPYFNDPAVAVVAPRVVPVCTSSKSKTLRRFLAARCPLDMGPLPGAVGPQRSVPFVPTAAVLVRRRSNPVFDPELHVGEDVDLVWRLVDQGWVVRYVPDVVVHHQEPSTWRGALARRFRYGGSVGPLSHRHPGRLSHILLPPWAIGVVVLTLLRRRRLAVALVTAHSAVVAGRCRRAGAPGRIALRWGTTAAVGGLAGIGHAASMFALPLVVAGVARKRTRMAVLLLVATVPALELTRLRPRLDPVRWFFCCVIDDAAYGVGVVYGCIVHRTAAPIRPMIRP